MLTGYCVRRSDDPGPPEGLRGVDGEAVALVAAGGLAAWVSDGGSGPPTLERVRDHDAVVRAALRSATPLPLRFGTRFADAEAVEVLLRQRRDEFAAALERVRGRVEVGLRLVWRQAAPDPDPDAEALPPRTGREYLERRRAALRRDAESRRRAEALLAELASAVAPLPLDVSARLLPEPGVAAAVAHLVQASELTRYRTLVDRARSVLPDVELVLTGPWAPYSFV